MRLCVRVVLACGVRAPQSKLRMAVIASMLVTNGLYLLVGVTAALFFGDTIKSQINLNFQVFSLSPSLSPSLSLCISLSLFSFPLSITPNALLFAEHVLTDGADRLI